jgi:hypothetical protein
MALPTIPAEASRWHEALYAFLVEKGHRSCSRRTVESYSRMLWGLILETTPDRVNPEDALAHFRLHRPALGAARSSSRPHCQPRSNRVDNYTRLRRSPTRRAQRLDRAA